MKLAVGGEMVAERIKNFWIEERGGKRGENEAVRVMIGGGD